MKKTMLALVTLVLCSVTLSGQNLQPQPMDTTIRYGKLSNGLTYYIRHNEQPKERAEFYIAQNVGAILEEDSQNGLAHFLEHMAFNGTTHFPGKKLINYFESIGVRFGTNINAYTSLDETVYSLSEVPTTREGIIDSSLLALHDWSSFILLEEAEIDKERGVIREEWRQRQNASRRLWKESNKVIMAGSQYAKRDIIGDTAVINNFTYETLRNYYKKWYRTDLQAILVVGDIDVNQIEAKIKTLFADIPAPVDPAERIYYQVPDQENPVTGVFTDPEMQTMEVEVYYRFEPIPNEVKLSVQGLALILMNNLITNMTNNRFDEISREPDNPFSSLYAYLSTVTRTKDAFIIGSEPLSGKETEARNRMLKEVELLRRFGFNASEFERAKASMISSYEKMYNEKDQQKNNRLAREYARHFLSAEGIPGVGWEYKFVTSTLPMFTLEMINQSTKRYLESKGVIYAVFGPKKDGLIYPSDSTLASELKAMKQLTLEERKDSVSDLPLIPTVIKPGKVKKEKTDAVTGATEWTLSNGIKVLYKSTRFKEDEIRVSVWSDGGSSLVSETDIPSVIYATSVISQSGLGAFDQTSLNKKLTGKIASIRPFIGTYEEGLNGSSSVKDLETLFQLINLYFTATRKDQNAFDIFERSARTYFENVALDPANTYGDSINAIMYNYHPRILPENVSTLEKMNFETLYRLYQERFANPGDFTFLFVGNLNPATFKPLVEQYIGGLKTTKKRETWKDNNIRHVKGPVYREIVKKLKVSKTSCYVHYLTELPYTLENRIVITTLANILRLRYTATIREEEGASYSVSVNGSTTYKPISLATLSIQFNTDPNLYKRMLGIVHAEIKRIAENGPTAEDLSKVKQNLLKQYKENQQENAWWSQAISTKYRDGIDLVNDYEKQVQAISIEAVQTIAKQFYDQQNVREIMLMPEE